MINCLITFYFAAVAMAELNNQPHFKMSVVSRSEDRRSPLLLRHGESPVWHAASRSLLFVDVHRQNVHRLDYDTGTLWTKHIAYGQVNVVSPIADAPNLLLVAVRAALYLLDWAVPGDAALRLLASVDEGLPDNVINEGKPDSEGRFWAGTKGPQIEDYVVPDKAALYSFEQDHRMHVQMQLRPVSISNGLVWSLNDSVMYYADSSTKKVEAFDFESQRGEISKRRTILDISEHGYGHAIPDGMTIDDQGNLWVALMFGGTVLHVDPDSGKILNEYKLPVPRVTSLAWGGPNLDELFVTTGQDSDSNENMELAGAIFTLRGTGFRGVPPHAFKFENAHQY